MIRLNRNSDYAMVLLVRLARPEGGGPLNARALAEDTRLPLPMVSKTLKALARAGLLASRRGARGGYTLARPAAGITVADVLKAMEGPVGLTECTSPDSSGCDHEPFCGVRENWRLINHAVLRALDGLTLADMARPITRPDLIQLSMKRPARGCAPALGTS